MAEKRSSGSSHEAADLFTTGSPLDDWPVFGLTEDIRDCLAAALADGPVALATLYASEGGTPRGVGTQMLITATGASGYISGGCIEADIALHGRAVIAENRPRLLVYGRGGPIDIQLSCGSRIEVLVEPLFPGDPASTSLLDLTRARREAWWMTDGRRRLCHGEQSESMADGFLFIRHYRPRQRLIIAGGDPVTLALASIASSSGHEVFIVRPKGPASPPPLGGVRYLRGEPADAFAQIGLDAWSAVVVAMHDPFDDQAVLVPALKSEAGYVGLLGSVRRLAPKLDRLRVEGIAENRIAALKAPVGLKLGGQGPWEIALSILAEIAQDAALRNPAAIIAADMSASARREPARAASA